MKTIREILANLMPTRCPRAAKLWKPILAVALGLAACAAGAQPANDNFAKAIALVSKAGITNGDNTLATLEPCETNAVNTPLYANDPIKNSVWYTWTAPANGSIELDTDGSALGLDFVLSVWTSTNALPTMCDGSLTNIASDDGSQGIYSQVNFSVLAGTTYYIEVSSYDDGTPGDNLGGYQLNWSAILPTLPAGLFQMSSTSYTVSETDSQAPYGQDGNTVNPSVRGARVTVTRTAPAHGRVWVDYAVTGLTYTNTFTTNFFGTNLLTTYIDTNNIISWTNYYTTNVYILSSYQSYIDCGPQVYYVTNGYTNASTLILQGVFQFTNTPVTGALASLFTNLPIVTNYQTSITVPAGGITNTTIASVFGYLQTGRTTAGVVSADGVTYTNGGVVLTNFQVFYTNTFITNYFGSNISTIVTAKSGVFASTNYLYTNVVFGYVYSTNSIYTNGVLTQSVAVSGTNWLAGTTNFVETILNASNRIYVLSPTGAATNYPPAQLGFFTLGTGTTIDASGNIITTVTNSYNQQVIGSQIVPSATGIVLGTNTLIFDDFQMSQDILIPVIQTLGPDYPAVTGIPSQGKITLFNPRFDPLEDTTSLIPPGLNQNSNSASIYALSTQYVTAPGGVFNFERSTFRVDKNVTGGNAIVSVNRVGGDGTLSVSVDYVIDPGPGLYGGFNPPCNFSGGYSPANTFPRQAGSDYATPNSDYAPVTGTLNWGAGDFNPKQITIPILNNGLVEFNEDFMIQLYNPQPGVGNQKPASLGEVNAATVTIPFDGPYALDYVLGGTPPGQQPAGAVDRTWNKDNHNDSTPPFLNYPGTTPGFGGTVYAVAVQPDGRAIIAGSFISFDSTPYNRIVRTLPNGYQDSSFLAAPNSGANEFIAAVLVQPDGRIIIGGNFTAFNGYDRHYIARLNLDGSVDTTFNPGLGANGRVWSIALNPATGQMVIGGEFTSYNGTAINRVARLNADGSLDTTFNPGSGPDGTVDAVALDPSGRVIIGGGFANVAGTASGGVARLGADGSLDTTFTPGIGTFDPETFVTDPVKTVAVQSDGRILIGGSFSYVDLVNYNGLARLNTDGTLDLTFQPGLGTFNPITAVADTVNTILLQPDGKILIGGNFTTYNQTRRVGLARVFPDGSLDTSFMDTAYNQFAGVPNRYFNQNTVAADYPYYNTRNAIYALALESAPNTASNLIVGGTFEEVGGGDTRDDIHPRSNVARVIGGITPGPGNLEFAGTSYSVNNSDGSLYVSLVRTNGNLGIVSVTFTTNTAAPGPGVAKGGDFSLNPIYANPTWVTAWWNNAWDYDFGVYGPNYATIPVNTRAADVYITVTNSGNISGNLSADFGLTVPTANFDLAGEPIPLGTALGTQNSAPLTIIDSNVKAGVIGFSAIVYSVIENGGNATITLTRTNGSDNSVTVWYATGGGTATNGVDYVGVTNQLTFGAGVISNSFTVTTKGHYTSIQPDKTVGLRLYTPSGGALLGVTNATLTLINPNYAPGHLSFSQADYPVNENGGPAVITVNRLGGSATTLDVSLLTRDGTAFNGINYLGSTNVLHWDSGDATSRTISIPVLDDGVVTPNLVANLLLTNSLVNGANDPQPLAFGGTNATLTVVNVDSAGSFQFSTASYSVKKYGGFAQIPITRMGGSIGTVTVSFTTLDDTAVHGVDYTFVTNTLTFTNGEVGKFVNVPVIDTGMTNSPSGPRDLFLQLSNPSGFATLGSPNPATLYIIDSDSVNETPGSPDPTYSPFAGFNGNVYALFLEPNNQLLVGGDFTMADGVARNHIARLNSDGSLDPNFSLPADTYGANDSVRAISMQVDGRILVGGFFTNFNSVARGHIARVNPDGTLDNLFNPGSGADNPVYAVQETFVNGVSKVLIGGAFASVSGTTFNGIGRLNTDGTPDTTFNLGGLGANATVYALAVQPDGKIVIGGDFTSVNGNANFNHIARLNPDGSSDTNFNVSATGPSDSVRTIALQLDGKILIGGFFTNVNGQAFNHIARLNADGTVDPAFVPGVGANDAVFALGIQSDSRIVVGGEFTTCSGVTRNRITRLNPDGTVDPSINFGVGANDFVAAIAIQEDAVAGYPTNVPDEKIIIGGGFTEYFGQPYQHIARIFGGSIGGSGAFRFSMANYQVDETGTNAVITVVRTGGTTNSSSGDIYITAATSPGTAVPNVNYSNVAVVLDFPLGEVIKTVTVPVMDDGVVTPNLTVNLALSNPTAPAGIGNQPTAVLTIINDDSSVSFSNSVYFVPKNIVSGVAAIDLVRSGGTNNTTTVNFTTTGGGTALPGTDYTPVSQPVIFNPGVSVVAVNIPINNNGIPEGNRTVTMQLSDAIGSSLINPTNATLTIIDTVNSPGFLSFASPGYTITEGGGVGYTNVYITVQRTLGSSGTVSVHYQTMDGTATAPFKYISTNGTLSFGDGEQSKTLFVPVANTTSAEGPETFSVVLSAVTGGASLMDPTNTVVTILNTNTGIAFASAANAFTEPSGPVDGVVLLNVVRFNNTNGTTTVNYSTTNGTAMDGVNFVGIYNGTLTFNPGESVKSIAVSTIYDPLVTGDLTFTVGLANPGAGAQLTPPSYTVVTDHDANAGISFYTNATSVYRNAGYVIIPVICSNTNVEPVSVNYTTGGGSAVAGVDYTATSGTLAFTNGAAFNYFIVPVLLNNAVQTNRTFNVTLSAPTPPGVLVPPSTETVTLIGTNTPPGLSFSTPIAIVGSWGTTNANNGLGAPESGDPAIAGYPASAPVWFIWTAPPTVNGEVALDTIGSASTNGLKMDTVLGVYTGASLSGLNQVAANDDLYPNFPVTQENLTLQNIFNTNVTVFSNSFTFGGVTQTIYFTNNAGEYVGEDFGYLQPYAGPSGLRFNAKAGTTYYIAVDSKSTFTYTISNGFVVPILSGRGTVQLNWAFHPSGVFRFATENTDQTGITDTNGNPMLLYQCSEAEGGSSLGGIGGIGIGTHRIVGPVTVPDYDTTFYAYYHYDVNGLLVTVTRVAGSSGRMFVDYSTQDGDTNIIHNGDVAAMAYRTNIISATSPFGGTQYQTNVVQDYIPVSGTLIFNDFEMSKTIVVPIVDDGGVPQPNRDFMVVLSNPRRDPFESGNVSAPRVDPIFGKVLCRILDCDIDPKGPSTLQTLVTNINPGLNITNVVTNTMIADQFGALLEPTNALFNFSKANYRVPRDVQAYWGIKNTNNTVPVTVYVNRSGTNIDSVTIHYRFDNEFLDDISTDDDFNEFPLQPGSDYATPSPANAGAIHGVNSDFDVVGGNSGSLTFPGGKKNPFQSQPIHFDVLNNHLTGFNKDILITIYEEDKNNNPQQDGMVAQTTVTILFDDTVPPAGSVDELYNPDFASDLAFLTNSLNQNTLVLHPGTDPVGDVYSVALAYQGSRVVTGQSNSPAIIGGAFQTYTDGTNDYTVDGIARLNFDGSLDPTFNLVSGMIASGVNVSGGEFVRSLAVTPDNKIVIGGNFSSFDNTRRNNVARLNSDGTLDTSFNPGAGANGTVWSVLSQADGKVVIGGEFTTFNGAAAAHVARLNSDGSLDTSFNTSNLLSGPVYAMALSPQTPFSYSRTSTGSANEDDQFIKLGLQTSGTLLVTFNMAVNTNTLQIYYGNPFAGPGNSVLLFQTTNTGVVSVPFGPVAGLATNLITMVVNSGGSIYAPPLFWDYTVAMAGQTNLMVAGNFKVNGQFIANVARLNTDGSLDGSFNPGTGPNGSVFSLGWQPDGRVVLGGSFNALSGVPLNNLARLNADGSIDSSFYGGTGADNTVNSITLQPASGLIYIGGPFASVNGTHRLGFARLNADGTVDTSFLDAAYNQFAGLPHTLFGDSSGVYSSALQDDGNVLIGGSFQQVGGGQVDYLVRYITETERGLQPSTVDPNLFVSEEGSAMEPKSRDGLRNRSNFARLIGGSTAGPGNIGMVSPTYAVNRSELAEPVTLVRNNGSLGYASANFSVLSGLAKSGTDYSYSGVPPLYPIGWEYSGPTRMHSDGQFGADGLMQDIYGELFKYGANGPASINVGIMSDNAVAGNLSSQFQLSNPSQVDQFYLGGQDIPLGVALGLSQAPLTLIDTRRQDGVFSFAAPSYVATNSPVSVAISRTNGSFGQVYVYYQTLTNGSTAVLNTDYRATNGYVNFNAGDLSLPFQVTIVNNSSIYSQEKDINIQLTGVADQSGGNAQLGSTNAVIRIINPNYPGYLDFTTNAYYAPLSAGVMNFIVERTVGGKGTLSVQYATGNGTAVSGLDFVGVTNTLTWNSGDLSPRFISIPLINHGVLGPNRLFTASLFNPTLNGTNAPSLLGPVTNAILAIVNDNNYGTFQFSSPNYQYQENGGYAAITVTRGGSALGTASVSCGTADGTAVAGINYVATNVNLTFLPGQLVKSFNVRLLNDGKTNPPPASFYFAVGLSSPTSGSALGAPTNSLVHIVDASSYNEPPGSVDASFNANVNGSVLALALQSSGQIVAGGNFTTADGSSINRVARFNTDGTLDTTFLNGLTGADGSVNAVVNQTDDRVMLGGSFANVNNAARGRIARLMTDGSLDTSFNPGAGADNTVYALAESFVNGSRVLYVGGAFATYNTIPSPGLVRVDNSGALDPAFAVGQGLIGTVYTLAVYPTNSVYYAGDVLVGGAFTNYNGVLVGNLVRLNPDGSVDTNFTQNVRVDNTVRALAIQLDGSVLVGGDFTNVNGTIASHLARLNPDGTLDSAFTLAAQPGVNGSVSTLALQPDNRIVVGGQFSTANGVSRQDVTRLLPTGAVDPTINFGTGANGAVNAVVIQPADGALVLGGAFTTFNNQPHEGIVRLFGGSTLGSGAFQFTTASYQVDEDGGVATISIQRTGGTSGTNSDGSGDVFVAFTTTNGSAVAGVNYTYTTNYVDFPAGEVLKNVFVPVQDDGVITPNLTVNLALSNPSAGGSLGDQTSAVLTIINDDNTVQFLSSTYSVPKNNPLGYANIQVVRVGSTSGSCTVNFLTTTNGSAVIGTDYYPTNVLITFNPGDTTNSVQVPVINNVLPEGNKTVTMTLTNAFSLTLSTTLASPSNAVLTIVDTSTNIGDLFFTQTNYSANANSGTAILAVSRTNGAFNSISANYTIDVGTAGTDLKSPTNGIVTLNAGDTVGYITLQLDNNSLQPVTLSVSLYNPQPAAQGAGLVAPTNATVTIFNDTPVFNFALATNYVAENSGPAAIVVQRLNNISGVSSVNYATVNGTAVAGINFSSVAGTLTFVPGQVSQSIAIPLINQSNIVDETFGVILSSPTNAVLVAPTNSVVVLQASAAGVSFPTNATSVLKGSGVAFFTVVCSNPRVEPVATATNLPLEVTYATVDGTARAGINYSYTTGTMVFTNGNGTNVFPVTIFGNNSVSSNLTFSLILTNVTSPGRIAPFGTESVAIIETNSGVRFSQSDYIVSKNAGQATVTVVRTAYTNSVVSVQYFVTNGTALAGQNFYPTNGTLIFTNGVTSQSFNVPLIANTQVQPNLFAFMQLLNATNAQIVNPGAATLTILETGGSYLVPAGSQLLTNSSLVDLTNNVIGSNDTVQVLFAFRNSAGQNVTNLTATLLVTNGVVSPSPASQLYTNLQVYGHSVSMPFSFTAHGTNSYTIAPTFQLTADGKAAGMATFVYTLGPWTTTFANTNAIIIPPNTGGGLYGTPATLYPSIINVSGVGNTLLKATVTLTNLSDGSIYDLSSLVVSPTTNTLLMAHVSQSGIIVKNITLTFDDAATNTLPLGNNNVPVSGTNRPSQTGTILNFP